MSFDPPVVYCAIWIYRSKNLNCANHLFPEWLFTRPIIVPLQEKSLKLGQRHEVNCTIISEKAITASISRSPGPNHRNHEILTQKARLTKLDRNVYRLSFTIEKPTINDTGLYTCEARNAIGISQRKFKIRVGAWRIKTDTISEHPRASIIMWTVEYVM